MVVSLFEQQYPIGVDSGGTSWAARAIPPGPKPIMIKSYIANECRWIVSTAALITVLFVSTGCVRLKEDIPLSKDNLKGSGKLYLVPLGDFPADEVNDLASFYRNKYGIQIETRPSVPLPPAAIDPERKQLIAEKAIEIMKQANPELTNDSQALMIGISNEDMYIAKYSWQFAFSYYTERKYAVVSCGRMVLPDSNGKVTEELFLRRLRKMITRNVGILYYRLPKSDNPRSVLYSELEGIDDLDYLEEEF